MNYQGAEVPLFPQSQLQMVRHRCVVPAALSEISPWQAPPLCAEKPVAVQLSRRGQTSVQYASSQHTWLHRVWAFLLCSCWNSFPGVVQGVPRRPDLHGAGDLCHVRVAPYLSLQHSVPPMYRDVITCSTTSSRCQLFITLTDAVTNITQRRLLGPDDFTDELFQIFKNERLLHVSQKKR